MKKEKRQNTPDEMRESILDAMLPHVSFDGWSEKSIKQAADDLGIETGIVNLAFPNGFTDIIELHARICDRKMVSEVKKLPINDLKIREKITQLVKLRILTELKHKEQAHRTVAFLALPQNHLTGLKILYRTVDLMWKTISDPSTDFNYYTKRMTLAAVYSSTFMYWLNDDSADAKDTWDFLDRRIENVMTFEKTKAKFKNRKVKMPDFWRELGKKRYGN